MLMLGREIEVPLDVITEPPVDSPPLTTEYALALQQRLAGDHETARRHLSKAAERQKRNYDKRVSSKPFRIGDSVWLHNIRRKKGRNPKLDCLWEGPCLVVSKLSDVTYPIQRSRRAKPKVIHADSLKPYLGPALESWIAERGETDVPAVSPVGCAKRSEPVNPGGSVSAELREGHVDGSPPRVSMESPNPTTPEMPERTDSDGENSDTEFNVDNDSDADIPSDASPVVEGESVAMNGQAAPPSVPESPA